MSLITDSKISSQTSLITPHALHEEFPASKKMTHQIKDARQHIKNILHNNDHRLVVIVGPCSIHDPKAAMEYAALLKESASRFANELLIVMRVYFEKPRTSIGWKGLISDPLLDGSFDINYGLKLARTLLIDLASMGIFAATEFLDVNLPPYFSDLITWGCIGARTSESQIHRELASGLAMPVGFKNSTGGNIKIAIDAVKVARHPHFFLGMNSQGNSSIISTPGNDSCHIILRGSTSAPNYTSSHIKKASIALQNAHLIPRLMVDCSHGNSGKNYQRQRMVIHSIIEQLRQKSENIFGVMLESNLVAGKQTPHPQKPLQYGQSITDACLAWEDTLPLLEQLARANSKREKKISQAHSF